MTRASRRHSRRARMGLAAVVEYLLIAIISTAAVVAAASMLLGRVPSPSTGYWRLEGALCGTALLIENTGGGAVRVERIVVVQGNQTLQIDVSIILHPGESQLVNLTDYGVQRADRVVVYGPSSPALVVGDACG